MFQGESEGETKKPERYVTYVEFLSRSSRFSFTIHPQGKINTARTVPCRITFGQASIRRVCEKWEAWKRELYNLEKISLGRCIKPSNFCKIINISLHNFTDTSEIGYGQWSYLRVVDENEIIISSLIMGKARGAPKNFASISRLEPDAAVSENMSYSSKNLMNISGQAAGLCWGTLLMIQEHSRPLLQTERT